MKNKFLVFYTILISAVYIFAVSYFGYSLYLEYSKASSNIYYIFNSQKLLESLKISILLILCATILTIILLIVSYCKKQNNYRMVMDEEYEEDDAKDVEYSEETSEQIEEDLPETEINEENTKTEEEQIEKSELPSEECKPVQIENNNVLFSEKTKFILEDYLEKRLDSELERAVSSEFDLALFIIRINKFDKNAEYITELSNYISVQFQFKDLIFEYKDDCIACIKTNCNIDEAVELADKIHKDIVQITKQKCYIGISTRTVRIISAERLIMETDQALKHAHDSESNPIIGFRANAEKYMEMMKNQ